MPPAVTTSFKSWLKGNVNMKLSYDAVVNCLTYEGLITVDSLTDFDKTSIKYLLRTFKTTIPALTEDLPAGSTTEAEVLGANMGTISV